ncbi:MAG: hypothetical protein IPG32_19270 [Saprospirales bacterium]|nr:hypothetical protein [Saprospirales bacterium]
MNNFFFILTAAGTLMLPILSCKKYPLEPKEGQKIEALLNGEYWEARTIILSSKEYKDNSVLGIEAFSEESFLRERLEIVGFSVSEEHENKSYNLIEIDSFVEYNGIEWSRTLTFGADGDVLTGRYYPIDCQYIENVLSISSIQGRIVEGYLEGCFVKSGGNDTITIEDGKFKAKIDWR